MVRSYTTEGIVLARTNFSEADRFLVIYTKHFGKIRLLAKGIRKPKSRKRGSLEVFSRVKFSVHKGKGFDIMTEAETIDLFAGIRKNLNRTALAYYYSEVIDKITKEDEKIEQLYGFLVEKFERLSKAGGLKRERENFINGVLVILGYWPRNQKMENHDHLLESIIERQISSKKIGKRILI